MRCHANWLAEGVGPIGAGGATSRCWQAANPAKAINKTGESFIRGNDYPILRFKIEPMFQDLMVVELASVLAGPTVGQFFAELGARVVKIENPATGGDVTRSWKSTHEQTDDRSAYFSCCNWGKETMALDLTLAADLDALYGLIARADVVIASYKPGDAEKLGVDYPKLKQLNPRLIYGSITGYGEQDVRVGYDAVIQAEAGWMYLNGEADGPPTKMPVAFVDLFAAHQLKEGLLLALLQRERSGAGDLVEVNLLQAALASLANQATNYLVGGFEPQRQGSAHPNIAPYGDLFRSSEGSYILLAVGTDRQFADLWQLLFNELPPLAFDTNAKRVANRPELRRQLQAAIVSWHARTLLQVLHFRKIPAGVVKTVAEALDVPQAKEMMLQANGLTGLRTYVGKHQRLQTPGRVAAPPHRAGGQQPSQ
jgi:crotonobetainyl-CoA:carnitine CoA-transferase CaiB-like acyl-CoA transferase